MSSAGVTVSGGEGGWADNYLTAHGTNHMMAYEIHVICHNHRSTYVLVKYRLSMKDLKEVTLTS